MSHSQNVCLILVGMMGSGKTTIGNALSIKLECNFIDTDQVIEEEENKTIKEIFDDYGEGYFRKLEAQLISFLPKENTIIATGGGMPIQGDNMKRLNLLGTTIFLDASTDDILQRINIDDTSRPLFHLNREGLDKLIEQRKNVYQKAQLIIETSKKNEEKIINEIIDQIN